MASVDFKKLHSRQDVAAMLRHSCADTRMQHKHSNRDIDKSRTAGNMDTGTYTQALAVYDARIQELDARPGQNRRSDRVTCFGLEVPAPAGLTEQQQVEFLQDAAVMLADKFNRENVIHGSIHVDEVHEYIDHGVVKQSRPHLHLYVVPEMDGKFNGKKFSSRAAMRQANRELDTLCREQYGVPFMTGGDARKRSVEELKVSSAMEVVQMRDKALQEAEKASERRDRAKQSAKAYERVCDRLEGKYSHMQDEIPKVSKRLRELRTDRDEIKRYLTHGSQQQRDMMQFMHEWEVNGRPLDELYLDRVQERVQEIGKSSSDEPDLSDRDDWFDR